MELKTSGVKGKVLKRVLGPEKERTIVQMQPSKPQDPSDTSEGTSEDTTHKLESHDNQPHPPKHRNKGPFQNHESGAANPP
jgi:hypothetical protein